ncbi:hypothetical protein CY34DRAFT_813454 [Suillus luteus UH-Slu-Lm8-n1]|uniref:DUF6533 domain-containing protein n=1 Tax=Suillus luteus UH-Slu-Lm8-n1 TaxID=930992 RepID=A0A0D0ANV5_9AGAM|nr:hypothetical protein CY34DRAFT_813454 [Suillus luteus UH-Slu-Lm8-n1]
MPMQAQLNGHQRVQLCYRALCKHSVALCSELRFPDGGISSLDTKSFCTPTRSHHPSNMTVVSNDPNWWPIIDFQLSHSYWIAAAGVVVLHDWVLTLGREIELIWKPRWSLMGVLYLIIRYIGILYAVANVLLNMTLVSLTDAG